MDADTEKLRQEIVIGLEAAERGGVAPLDIEATIAEAKSCLAEKRIWTRCCKRVWTAGLRRP